MTDFLHYFEFYALHTIGGHIMVIAFALYIAAALFERFYQP